MTIVEPPTPRSPRAVLGPVTHPWTVAVVLMLIAVADAALVSAGALPVLSAWVVLALAAGYSISGSV
ncbi:hypothetical protein DLJ58_29040 [Micromonospora arida]|uniref:Uncharacterized protein n=1 Tax=Micromonospora arida TaxID=2203715 RepID=A0A3N9XBU2_9ACTN|nr:hypothetical protein DLJ58_29040 [Micromonospora arida]